MLEKVVNIDSGTLNLEGVHNVDKLMVAELDMLGFKTEWVSLFTKRFRLSMSFVATYP
ncbi:hypothetical protein GCM10027185_45700 [Spirosoma pulveris]